MKMILVSALVAGLIAAPAMAASMTLSFAADGGETQEWTLHDDGTATSGDVSVPYTWDETGGVLCSLVARSPLFFARLRVIVRPKVGARTA